MDFMKDLVFYIICFFCLFISVSTTDICQPLNSCSCEFPNGTGIDLTPAEKSTFFTAQNYKITDDGTQIELNTYYYHPCYDIKMVVPTNSTENSSCTDPLSICRHMSILKRSNVTLTTYNMIHVSYDFMAKTEWSKFSPSGDNITYANGPSSTTVLLICAQTDDTLHIVSLEEPNQIVLSFNSRSACLTQISTGRSFGSTLLIIFFSCAIFYLVLGICTKKFLMGATGIEVIPNLSFWSDLPNLVKDGWAFMINGFKLPVRATNGAVRTPDPNSYDSI